MKDLIFCVYDRLALRYVNVFSSATRATAEQQFKVLFQKNQDAMKDFDLCVIGSIDVGSGQAYYHPVERVDVSLTENKSEVPITEIEKNL